MCFHQMKYKFLIPLVHAEDLELVLSLTRALGQVALGPFAKAGGDLLYAHDRIFLAVSIVIDHQIFIITTLRSRLILVYIFSIFEP